MNQHWPWSMMLIHAPPQYSPVAALISMNAAWTQHEISMNQHSPNYLNEYWTMLHSCWFMLQLQHESAWCNSRAAAWISMNQYGSAWCLPLGCSMNQHESAWCTTIGDAICKLILKNAAFMLIHAAVAVWISMNLEYPKIIKFILKTFSKFINKISKFI